MTISSLEDLYEALKILPLEERVKQFKLKMDRADVIIDFSHPNNLDDILAYAKRIKQKLFLQQLVFLRNN